MSDSVSTELIDDDHAGSQRSLAVFVTLGLAQLVIIFAAWLALFPTAFELSEGSLMGPMLGVGFVAAACGGLYLAVSHLT